MLLCTTSVCFQDRMNGLDDPNGTIKRIKTPSRRRRDGLIQHAYDKTSQSGEDGIINFLFRKLPIIRTATKRNGDEDEEVETMRWAVDVGAWDGKHLSNTHSLFFQMKTRTKKNHKYQKVIIGRESLLKQMKRNSLNYSHFMNH